jgi:hypothetical protein
MTIESLGAVLGFLVLIVILESQERSGALSPSHFLRIYNAKFLGSSHMTPIRLGYLLHG